MPRHKYGAEPSSLQEKTQDQAVSDQPELSTNTSIEGASDGSESEIRQKPIKQQAKAIQARWAAEEATEVELRAHFLSVPLEKALALLAKMRQNCTTAGTILNDRINTPSDQKCKGCGKTYEELKKTGKPDWWLNRPFYDPQDRNIIHVDHFCGASCVSMENNKTQGVRGIADRGMLRSDNPKNHPHV